MITADGRGMRGQLVVQQQQLLLQQAGETRYAAAQ